ncbi:hypothetical protein CGSMWGv1500E_00770 [Gardnerella vaginalis 1500E]|uniref:Uncharacterized protein n=1 Tax=Gardnerella vaginalis 1500E TaxID=698957 RepID=I4M4T1_GARVA|nr:hypothetical protein CGSMWGv1500E_00770 [Gardnerella vaginalis 1500E]
MTSNLLAIKPIHQQLHCSHEIFTAILRENYNTDNCSACRGLWLTAKNFIENKNTKRGTET